MVVEVAGRVTLLVMPLSVGVWATSVHVSPTKLERCWTLSPVEGDGQQMTTLFPEPAEIGILPFGQPLAKGVRNAG